jgi:hypothetical protein
VPLVLSQHFHGADRPYDDVEGALYHYPRVYFSRVKPFSHFIYYRPLGESARRPDSKTYFGHGTLGMPYEDPRDPSRRFVDVIQYEAFPRLVGLQDGFGNYYETGTTVQFQAQAAVREISDIAYHRMLAAAGVALTGVSLLPNTTLVPTLPYAAVSRWPMDDFRTIREIPGGAGYVPRGGDPPNVYEAAALQERARKDHQGVLASIAALAHARGGQTLYNNNVDLVVRLGEERILVEAKSLNDPHSAVDRMRYGMGQLFDYGVRYRAQLAGATPLLAFGRPPDADTAWIADILGENEVAFACLADGDVRPFNEKARGLTLFS